MNYFKIKEEELLTNGAIYTAQEIWNQPSVWKKTYDKLSAEKNDTTGFWNEALKNSKKIILTGAGTSAYIGFSLEGAFQRHTGIPTVSLSTTHLVTHPEDYFQANIPTLLISFARSGNSPESVATVKLADKLCNECYHLIITCDVEGELAKYHSKHTKHTFVLPPESNDKSLAMTSSYTSMLLSGLLFARLDQIESLEEQVANVVKYGTKILEEDSDTIKDIAKLNFGRAVFLGSGPQYGTATEAHLKLQELSDGQVICKNDSFLGFRHGPKAVVDKKTIVMFFFSNKAEALRYEKDLVNSMQKGKGAMMLIGVSETPVKGLKLNKEICFSASESKIDEEFLAVCSVLPAQILGLFKSLELGLKPDNPSVSGAISRVVEGVIIYDL